MCGQVGRDGTFGCTARATVKGLRTTETGACSAVSTARSPEIAPARRELSRRVGSEHHKEVATWKQRIMSAPGGWRTVFLEARRCVASAGTRAVAYKGHIRSQAALPGALLFFMLWLSPSANLYATC